MAKIQAEILKNSLDNLCGSGVAEHIFPGCVAGVSIGREKKRFRLIGKNGILTSEKLNSYVNIDSYYDLASLTKPLCTAGCVLKLVEDGFLDWNTPVAYYFDDLQKSPEKENITVGHLASHCSGFSAYSPYFKDFTPIYDPQNKKRLLKKIFREKLIYKTGTQNVYSDWGYILLGELIEQIAGMSIDSFFKQTIAKPFGLTEHIFFPSQAENVKEFRLHGVAATEKCHWRNKVMEGEVHDEHCWLLGGVAGHAGLFANIYGVLSLCEHILDSWVGQKEIIPGLPFYKLFTHYTKNADWYLGFDTPTVGGSTSGRYFSLKSAGHLGFTGTSLWMDPEQEVIVVLLSNRVHPARENEKIRQFRPYFHDTLMEKILQKKPRHL